MIKKVIVLIFMTFLSSNALAGSNYIIHSEIVDGAASYAHIDPIKNAENELYGFIYSDSINSLIIIDRFDGFDPIVISTDIPPVKTIHYINNDTLFLYTLLTDNLTLPQIQRTILFEDEKLVTTFTPVYSPSMGLLEKVIEIDIRFTEYDFNSNHLLLESVILYEDYIVTQGPVMENISTSILYSPDLSQELINKKTSSYHSGYLSGMNNQDFILTEDYYFSYSFTDGPDDNNYGTSRESYFDLYDYTGTNLLEHYSSSSQIYKIFVGDFKRSSPYDELIYYAHSTDILDNYPEKTRHVACYSFSDGIPEELWYNDEIDDITLDYVFAQKDYIAGRRGANEIVFLDYLSGQLSDSTNLERDIDNALFFETGSYPSELNLVGNSGDTVIVYRFDMPTYVSETSNEPIIPATFTMFQNHPNPFNGETRIEFENTVSQNLELSVYNILGQKVKTLATGNFSVGQFQFYWDGADEFGTEQSTGVYFARLQGDLSSQMIKLIYIK